MTTIIGIKTKDGIFIAGDQQTTEGNLKMVDPSEKILVIGNNLVASCGSVGNSQQMLKRAVKEIMFSQVLSNALIHLEIAQPELAGTLADLNFSYPNEYKYFSPYGFLVGGINSNLNAPILSAIGDDGSNMPIQTYYAMGSGSQIAIGKLNSMYDYNMDKVKVLEMLQIIIKECGDLDVYTFGCAVKSIELDEGIWKPIVYDFTKEPDKPEAKEKKPKKQVDKSEAVDKKGD